MDAPDQFGAYRLMNRAVTREPRQRRKPRRPDPYPKMALALGARACMAGMARGFIDHLKVVWRKYLKSFGNFLRDRHFSPLSRRDPFTRLNLV